jgi:hypothetical protein
MTIGPYHIDFVSKKCYNYMINMKETPRTSPGDNIAAIWDGMNFAERLQFIMTNENLFWIMRLITRSEIARLHQMRESAREYVVEREDHPFFASLELKKDLAAQTHRDKLKAALCAVFL